VYNTDTRGVGAIGPGKNVNTAKRRTRWFKEGRVVAGAAEGKGRVMESVRALTYVFAHARRRHVCKRPLAEFKNSRAPAAVEGTITAASPSFPRPSLQCCCSRRSVRPRALSPSLLAILTAVAL